MGDRAPADLVKVKEKCLVLPDSQQTEVPNLAFDYLAPQVHELCYMRAVHFFLFTLIYENMIIGKVSVAFVNMIFLI